MNEYDVLINSLFAKAELQGIPLSGAFELTSRCTLDCKMCYIHHHEHDREAINGEKDTAWWSDLAKQAAKAGTLPVLLTGGEPMIRRDFEEIYLACKNSGLLVSVNTNGTLINSEKLRFFKENPPQKLNVTLYGTSKETYAALCGNGDIYETVVEAIRKLKEENINVKLNYTVTPQNISDAPDALDFAKELQIPIQPVTYMFPPVRTQCGEMPERLTPQEAAKAHFEWQKKLLGDGFADYLKNKSTAPPPYADIGECGERINCRAGSTTFWITWKGEMTPCGMMNEPSVPVEDFNDAWKKIRAIRKEIFLPSECTGCEFRRECDMCAAVAYAETGNFNGKPDYVCRKAHEYSRLCKDYLTPRQ